MKFISSLLLFSVFSAPIAFARVGGGNEGGNGGNTVVCKDANGAITSAELLDFYEARVQRGFTIDLGDKNDDVAKKITLVMGRLAKFRPAKAKRLGAMAEDFQNQAKFLSNVEMPPVDDSFNEILPTGCKREQTVIQKTPEFPEDKTYLVNQDIWNHLDNDSKAGLVLHEIFYHDALSNSDTQDSVEVRYFNAYLASTKFATLDEAAFENVEAFVHWPSQEFFGVEFMKVTTDERSGSFCWEIADDTLNTLQYQGQSFTLQPLVCNFLNFTTVQQLGLSTAVKLTQIEGKILVTAIPGQAGQVNLSFFPSGKIYEVSEIQDSTVTVNGIALKISGSGVSLHESGALNAAYVTAPFTAQVGQNTLTLGGGTNWDEEGHIVRSFLEKPAVFVDGKEKISQPVGSSVSFYPSGALETLDSTEDALDLSYDGKSVRIKKGSSIRFNEDGSVFNYDEPRKDSSCTVNLGFFCAF